MEGRPPNEPDDLDFDFDAPRRRQQQRETGEHAASPSPGTGEQPFETGEGPYETGERPGTGERPATGEPAYETGESRPETGEDPLATGERPRRRERPKKRRGLRLGRGRGKRGGRRERPAASTDTGEERLRDDPYTPAKVPVAGTRRSRHRDLPAKVRRRQAALAGGVVVLVLVAAVAGVSALVGGGGDDEEQPLGVKRLVGQTVIGKLGKDGPDKELLRRVRKGQLGGVIVSQTNEQTLSQQVNRLQKAAEGGDNPDLLILIDQEGGDVKRLPGPPDVAPQELGQAGADAARSEGENTGTYLKGLGVNVDLAPVLDVELPQTADTIAGRTFGEDPAVVSEVGSAFIEGLQGAGVAATAKHFPGLGPATVNTDFAPTTIAARDETLTAALEPFQAAVDVKVALMMVASATYPSYGPENPKDPNRPANAVKAIVDGLLRGQLGFQGLVITDDLESIAIETLTTPESAGVAALGAGCDLILYARSLGASEDAFKAVVRAVKQQKLSRDQIQASYDRITALKQTLES